MVNKIAILGGDLRIVKLAEMLTKENFLIKTYALEKAENLKNISEISFCSSIEETIKEADLVIGPIPLSNNNLQINTPFSEKKILLDELLKHLKNKIFLAGNVKEEYKKEAEKQNVQIIDVLKREELVVLNTIATAEGAIQIAMEETDYTLHGSNILVLGFGRVGKTVAYMLKGIGANVYVEARKQEDMAWIKIYGYQAILLNEMQENLEKFDIIINTIPSIILKEKELSKLKKECLVIDLASYPGGIEQEAAKRLGIKTIWALALPGKVAPVTSAKFIKDTIFHITKEIEEKNKI